MVQTDPAQGESIGPPTRGPGDDFTLADWALLAGTALMWGSSFVWIEEGLEAFPPPLITFLRIALGATVLAMFPQARRKMDRWGILRSGLVGLVWMAIPFLLFPIAQQWIDSSLAGMINGATPIFATLIAAIALKASPSPRQLAGIVLGFVGVLVVGWPAVNSEATALGVALVLIATFLYGIAINLAAPLQRRYGSLPVLLRAQLFALALTAPPGLISLSHAHFKMSSAIAMIPLGALGTGLAFVCMTTLVGRVGPSRGSITIYFVPLVAIGLGPLLRNEILEPVSLAGTVMVLTGAYLASKGRKEPRRVRSRDTSPQEQRGRTPSTEEIRQ